MTLTLGDLAGRLLIAAFLGAIVGIERDAAARGAGARTHALVALGAALFTVAGAYGFSDASGAISSDPSRIAAQVATGVGFIGAGAIIRHGASVQGITTAATVWLSASLGVAVAAGAAAAAALATLGTMAVLIGLRAVRPLTQRLGRYRAVVELDYERGHGTLGPLLRSIEDLDGRLEHLAVGDDDIEAASIGLRHVTIHLTVPRRTVIEHLVETVGNRPEVRSVRISPDGG